jgi:hypothetical protein
MSRTSSVVTTAAAAVIAVIGGLSVAPAPAWAALDACTVSPAAGQHGASPATVTCPAGAGTFTFRVAATCADAYPVLHLSSATGPWVTASSTTATTSSVPCNGAVPGSGFVWSAAIEVR